MRRLTDRLRRGLSRRPLADAAAGEDAFEAAPPLAGSQRDVERWNEEWLDYLRREWQHQLSPHSEFPLTPALPDDPLAMLDLELRPGWPLHLYCHREWLEGRRVMELGCGCGSLGKQLGRYVGEYLGTDYSTLALQVARLVSPANCTYIHVADVEGLRWYYGYVHTAVSRHFWIHQNLPLARENLSFLARFLAPHGRLYADFFSPDERQRQFVVRPADAPLSARWPSAMFEYGPDDVARWLYGMPFRLLSQTVVGAMQRRYVVLERLPTTT